MVHIEQAKLDVEVKSNPRRFFMHARGNRHLKQQIAALRVVDGTVVADSANIARALANYFASADIKYECITLTPEVVSLRVFRIRYC